MINKMGRPTRRTEPYRRTTLDIPVSLIEFLKTKPNRTAWIIQAIQEKREREQAEAQVS